MTGRRGRLGRLEARRREAEDLEVIGIFEADPDAGMWVDVQHGRTFAMKPEEIEQARQASEGGGAMLTIPLPGHARKIIYGVRAADL